MAQRTSLRPGVRALVWGIGFLVFTLFGLSSFGYRVLDDFAHGRFDGRAVQLHLVEEMTGAYSAGILFALVVRFTRRLATCAWWPRILGHVAMLFAFAASCTTLMALSRRVLVPLLGLGRYDYGNLLYRYPMEATKQLTIYLTWVTAILLFERARKLRARELATAELERRLAEAQLDNLRLQIHPHFLFNTLNTISSLMYEDVERADAMLSRLSDLLRRTLGRTGSQEVPLGQELEVLELYVEMMRARFGDDLAVSFQVAPETRQALVPQLILQPLLENSLRHGADRQTHRVSIVVCCRRQQGDLLLEVRDRGPGVGAAPPPRGLGLTNTASRLQTLYGLEDALSLENGRDGGLTVTVRLPFREAQA
jgi:signal transduction histidine kinase